MQQDVQGGTILIETRPVMALELQSVPYLANWEMVNATEGFALHRKIHAAGWSFSLMAAEVKVKIFGVIGGNNIQNALQRILKKAKPLNLIVLR